MMRWLSRSLSLVVVAASLWKALNADLGIGYVALGIVPILVLIWFPETVDEYTFGNWLYGYRIDSHTPALPIAAAGWILLLPSAYILFDPDGIAQLFKML